jgi:hypothetical protein
MLARPKSWEPLPDFSSERVDRRLSGRCRRFLARGTSAEPCYGEIDGTMHRHFRGLRSPRSGRGDSDRLLRFMALALRSIARPQRWVAQRLRSMVQTWRSLARRPRSLA